MKSDKIPYIIYAGIESLIKKLNGCANSSENSSTAKTGEHNIQSKQLEHLITWKTNKLYIAEKTA